MVKLILKIVLLCTNTTVPKFYLVCCDVFLVFFLKSKESYSSVHTGNKVITDC